MRSADQLQPGQGCSVIYATDGELVLAGNNEDYLDPLTKVWFIPAQAGSLGKVYFGFENYQPQGGMNDQGLFFDALALDGVYPISTTGKQEFSGNLVDKIMSECSTVACAVEIFDQVYTSEFWFWQFFFGDAGGESAIIEPQAIIRQRGGYQAATNFLQSLTPPDAWNDPRYQTAIDGLENMGHPSVASFKDLLKAIHMEGLSYTLYSNIYDLKGKLIYLYYFHNYEDVVVLNLEEELAKGVHAYDLPALFPPNPRAENWAAPILQKYSNLIQSRLDESVSQDILKAYAGEYEMLEGWGEPDKTLTIISQDQSLFLRFPDYHQHELFPASRTDFYYIAFLESGFTIAYEVHFSLDEEGRILYLDLLLGGETFRSHRLGSESFIAPAPTSRPSATSAPTKTPMPTATIEKTVPLAIVKPATATPGQPTPRDVPFTLTSPAITETTPLTRQAEEEATRSIGPLLLGILGIIVIFGILIYRRKH